jgi:hypothetical protein
LHEFNERGQWQGDLHSTKSSPCKRIAGHSSPDGLGDLSFICAFVAKNVQRPPVSLCAFLVLWLGASALLALSVLWMLLGVRIVVIQNSQLMISHKIGPATIGRPKAFAIAHIKSMHIEERSQSFRGKTTVKRAITFDYLGQREELLSDLSAGLAESLLSGPLRRFVRNTPL